jgi:plasmid stability protein
MVSINVQLDDNLASQLRQLAAAQQRSENDVVRDALVAYTQSRPPIPKGVGQYHSGDSHGSQHARQILREAARTNEWP